MRPHGWSWVFELWVGRFDDDDRGWKASATGFGLGYDAENLDASGEHEGRRKTMTVEHSQPGMVVDGAWLQAHLGDANLRIVDCDTRGAYERAHIPGAVWPSKHPYKDPDSPLQVMAPDQFAAAMSDLGIGDDTTVVAYDSGGGVSAGRLWWCLKYYGHKDILVLDGGWGLWLKQGRPVSMAPPSVPPSVFMSRVDESLLATAGYVRETLSRPDVVVLDVRTDAEWDGSRTPGNNSRGGHIPGSVHLEWTHSLAPGEDHCLLPTEELREMLAAAGVTPDKEVVTV
jgi:thiosulfate/3-mercaptopyruvate sulfurtransferase